MQCSQQQMTLMVIGYQCSRAETCLCLAWPLGLLLVSRLAMIPQNESRHDKLGFPLSHLATV